MTTVRELLARRAGDDRPGLLFEDRRWSWREHVADAAALATGLGTRCGADRPRHVGALLDNVPEMTQLISAAGLGGFTLVGLNTTRRGDGLAGDVRRSDCQVVVTEPAHRHLLDDLDLGDVTVLDVSSPEWRQLVSAHQAASWPETEPAADDLMMLIFTSGTSGDPKAVRITHEKVAFPGEMLADRFGLGPDDVCYLSMPLFHSNAVMAGYAPALAAGATIALARRFSASAFLPDVRRYRATYANYVGKPLTYVLATPEQPDDADNPLRVVFGNEAADRDIEAFGRRFGCVVVDSYSSTENAVIVQRTPDMPPGALGRPLPGVEVLDPGTGAEVPVARRDDQGRLLNGDEAIGELVNTSGAGFFAGYYNDPDADAERMRGGMYWSGDLAFRDADGFVYFAGRSAEWLRVDGENLAVTPIEQILHRHPDVLQAAVYAVPDDSGVGDQVMAALVLRDGREFDAAGFEAFLGAQSDLGAKSRPRHVRVASRLPQTPTNKVLKRALKGDGVDGHPDPVWSRAERGTSYTLVSGG
ncbi:MAG: Long-chain-fatty-acid--CoA ligase @ Long-chain fatty-acid-CoA ligase, Mycobacterial subgroup FadD17 [uncultured Nocardioidaceae bacterium]|uniref:Long-chain-fatty-acid--CoA ligase @ Long-chain fatty-acid-CoA ligase, Mycobacterial subgroup FadD17 n=1 Tax=uncultured Nocardioidaceae bacterium TaxID=253824 RepID=A0A6J4N773_9ACTN|nr:MAG: Long-chain-fatty-acid--CoA ligase @ Long-chain fatty-acid-CoA ligase, Mycobacterial subgroup FadD17 [uncultured Nocardioidaceae bacterium]